MSRLIQLLVLMISLSIFLCSCSTTSKSSPAEDNINRTNEARAALERLYQHAPGARSLGSSAHAVLVFPDITKAGFLIGGQYGTGVLFKNGQVAGFYRSTAASYGLQAGVQQFGYALFFMQASDVEYLDKSEGWEIGVGPSITVVDKGFATSMTSTTLRKGVYAFFFEQKGLMAGLGIQGTKITRTE